MPQDITPDAAYQFTQSLPQTCLELQCLLFCCGVPKMNETDEMCIGWLIAKMDRAGKQIFIPNLGRHVTLPSIYADLIALYGDTKLAAKLGRGLPART
jgi:hypothetical protein